jgi:hypothetical protein
MVDVNTLRFLKINNETVLNFIGRARERIIIAKPAFFTMEIEALIKARKEHKINIDLYMEAGDRAFRLGFGEKSALNVINTHLHCFNIQYAERIKMAILCFDNNALLYPPNLIYSEAENLKPTFANGFLCNGSVAKVIIDQFPALEYQEAINRRVSDNVIEFPGNYVPD